VNEDDDLVEYVERLENATDPAMVLSDEVSDDQLQLDFGNEASDADAAELVDEVERFLREQNSE
jgi:hypothetical protein